MRLTQSQRDAIVDVILAENRIEGVEIFLYGSRIDDSLKGGDIDLLVIVPNSEFSFFQNLQFKILNNLKKQKSIGDRKIDLRVATREDLQTDPFLLQIVNSLVKLH